MIDTQIKTKIGLFNVTHNSSGRIFGAIFIDEILDSNLELDSDSETSRVKSKIQSSIKNYFKGKCDLADLNFSLKLNGTDFQIQVWKEIMKIPYGQTMTYADIAQEIGRPTAYRAVAMACSQNKIALFIPCHRVVSKKNIGGFKWGLDKKLSILKMEGSVQ